MDWLKIGELLGAMLVVIYSVWNVFNKFLDQTEGRKKKIAAQKEREKQELEERITGVITPIIEPIREKVDEIKEINEEQSVQLKNLTTSEKDSLRKMIMDIYQAHEDTRALPESVREQLDELYKDYKSLHGNSYIDKYYCRMSKWDTIYDNDAYL